MKSSQIFWFSNSSSLPHPASFPTACDFNVSWLLSFISTPISGCNSLNNGIPSQEGQGHPRAQQATSTLPPPSASALPKLGIFPQPRSLQGSQPTMRNRRQWSPVNGSAKLSLKNTVCANIILGLFNTRKL